MNQWMLGISLSSKSCHNSLHGSVLRIVLKDVNTDYSDQKDSTTLLGTQGMKG